MVMRFLKKEIRNTTVKTGNVSGMFQDLSPSAQEWGWNQFCSSTLVGRYLVQARFNLFVASRLHPTESTWRLLFRFWPCRWFVTLLCSPVWCFCPQIKRDRPALPCLLAQTIQKGLLGEIVLVNHSICKANLTSLARYVYIFFNKQSNEAATFTKTGSWTVVTDHLTDGKTHVETQSDCISHSDASGQIKCRKINRPQADKHPRLQL